MTAEGPKAGLTHSRSLIVDPSIIVSACRPARPAHRHAAGAGDSVQGGFGRDYMVRCPEAFSQGRKLRFKLECLDEKEIIGTGFHKRAVIDPARFLAREKTAAG